MTVLVSQWTRGLDKGSIDEECYGKVRLQPLVYMDDTARASQDVNSMRAGNVKIASLMREKQLEIHPTKYGFLIFGSEQFKYAYRMDIKKNPVQKGIPILYRENKDFRMGKKSKF